jgi:hypothetical protein
MWKLFRKIGFINVREKVIELTEENGALREDIAQLEHNLARAQEQTGELSAVLQELEAKLKTTPIVDRLLKHAPVMSKEDLKMAFRGGAETPLFKAVLAILRGRQEMAVSALAAESTERERVPLWRGHLELCLILEMTMAELLPKPGKPAKGAPDNG